MQLLIIRRHAHGRECRRRQRDGIGLE
jgi:hypothetical protein